MLAGDIGSYIKPVQGPVPSSADGAVTSGVIDRKGYNSCILHLMTGAATGGPTAQTMDCKIQHCATSGGTYADLAGAAVTQITADNGEEAVKVDLRGAYRYLKVVRTAALTAGTSPTWPAASSITFGGADTLPTTLP